MYCPKCGDEYREGFSICAVCEVPLVSEEPVMLKVMNLYAGFFRRTIAALIDMAIYLVFIVPMIYFISLWASAYVSIDVLGVLIIFFISLVIEIIPFWLYNALSESSRYKATIGKRLMKIIVLDEKGSKITFGRASARAFCKILSILFYGVSYIMALFTKKKQGIHDIITSTVVIYRDCESTFIDCINGNANY